MQTMDITITKPKAATWAAFFFTDILHHMYMKEDLPQINDVQVFLNKHHGQEVTEVALLSGGKHSLAFGYTNDFTGYVIRFNQNKRGFLKDKYAYDTYGGGELHIPKIYSIGQYSEYVYYCISEKVDGETPKDQYKNGDFSSLPLQFEMIEKIKDFKIPEEYSGYDELEVDIETRFTTHEDYLMNIYTSKELFDWDELKTQSFFDQTFVEYLVAKVRELSKYSADVREVVHGDFGNENIFIKDGKVTGIIDWERLRFADHFLDVGRVVLFCPNREETVRAALTYYENKEYEHYKERIMLGVYFAMLRNYGAAATEGNETSCGNARSRIEQVEELMEI